VVLIFRERTINSHVKIKSNAEYVLAFCRNTICCKQHFSHSESSNPYSDNLAILAIKIHMVQVQRQI